MIWATLTSISPFLHNELMYLREIWVERLMTVFRFMFTKKDIQVHVLYLSENSSIRRKKGKKVGNQSNTFTNRLS